MEIRKRLAYQFIAIVAVILLLSSVAVYVSFAKSRKEEFYHRLSSKARLVSQMLFDIEEIDAELLRRIEKNNPVNLPNEHIIIYDYQNRILFSSDEWQTIKISTQLLNKVRLLEEVRYRQGEYEVLAHFYTGEYDRVVVFAAATDIWGINKLNRLGFILIVVFVSGMLIVYSAGVMFAARALKPISEIIAQVDGINFSNLDFRVDEGNGKDEIARLAKTFNKMLARLVVPFKIQRSFISNASHELRTPLTALTGQLEVALMKARSKNEYKVVLESALEGIKNLNTISNGLLLLAQASSELSDGTFAMLRVDEVLWQARNEVLSRNNDLNVNIAFGQQFDDEEMLKLNGNEILLRTAFVNLIDNACKYSADKTVEITLNSAFHKIEITFSDRGIGIPEEDIDMIFIPFYRSRNAKNFRGNGIGLSIVDKIVKMHQGAIDVTSSVDKGSTFTILFPGSSALKASKQTGERYGMARLG